MPRLKSKEFGARLCIGEADVRESCRGSLTNVAEQLLAQSRFNQYAIAVATYPRACLSP